MSSQQTTTDAISSSDTKQQVEEWTEAERNLMAENKPPLYRFVFTGGPCGGKTTALARAFLFLRERGFEVITCPEAYTLLSSNGMSVDFFSTPGMGRFIQSAVMKTQLHFEDTVLRVLQARGKPAIILCDRGLMDGAVYVSRSDFRRIALEEFQASIVELRDNRYDAIFHLLTAADGAEPFYSLENNKVRTETIEEAREVDKRTQKAWVGHPHLYVIDNSTDFEGKMTRLIDTICKIVGLPSNLKRRSAKFLLRSRPDVSKFPPEIDYHIFEVEKVYIRMDSHRAVSKSSTDLDASGSLWTTDNYSFIRRRTNIDAQGNRLGSVYQITTVKQKGDEVVEEKRIITEREYQAANMARDRQRHIVQQKRISFLYNQQSFAVHMYEQPAAGLCILHAQVEAGALEGDEPDVQLPTFLDVDRRLLGTKDEEEQFGAYSLSVIRPDAQG